MCFFRGITIIFGFDFDFGFFRFWFFYLIGLELTFSNSVNIYSLWISHAWAVCLHLLWKIINPSLDCVDIVSKLHNLSVQFTSQILDFKLAINSSWIYDSYNMNGFNLTSGFYWRLCLSFIGPGPGSVSSPDFYSDLGRIWSGSHTNLATDKTGNQKYENSPNPWTDRAIP